MEEDEEENITVIKCYLRSRLKPEIRDYIIETIQNDSFIIGKMFRRASLFMNYYIKCIFERNLEIPDLYKWDTTKWKEIFKIGLIEYDKKIPDNKDIKNIYKEMIKEKLIEDSIVNYKLEDNSDQKIAYASIQLKTIAINNIKIPFYPRIQRFCKNLKKYLNDKDIKWYDIYTSFQTGNLNHIPEKIKEYIINARNILGINYIDHYSINEFKTSEKVMKLYYYMSSISESHGYKGMTLFPIFKVERKSVRLDQRILITMLKRLCKEHKINSFNKLLNELAEREKYYKDNNPDSKFIKPLGEKPDKKKYFNEKEFLKHKEKYNNYKISKPNSKDFKNKEEYNEELKNWKSIKIDSPLKKDYLDEEKYLKDLEILNEKIKHMKNTEEYKNCVIKQNELIELRKTIALSPFIDPFNNNFKNIQPSICSDGVSVSFQIKKTSIVYKKEIKKPIKKIEEKEWNKLKEEDKSSVNKDYIILGLDPGRVCLATIAIKDGNNIKKWKLSRGEFYCKSLITKMNKQQIKLYQEKGLIEKFSQLGRLNSVSVEETKKYIKNYNTIKEEWWNIVYDIQSSLDKMLRYRKKRQCIDKFFQGVLNDCKKYFKDKIIKVAYGHCGPTMCSNGKGELSVPTNGSFKSCQRIFGKNNVLLTNEYNSTKKCHRCCCSKDVVYCDEKNHLFHVQDKKNIPYVKKEKEDEMNELFKKEKIKKHKRRGAIVIPEYQKPEKSFRYPEVRGLRFCPECRKYRDRDIEAALTIGLYQVLETKGLGRPYWANPEKLSAETSCQAKET